MKNLIKEKMIWGILRLSMGWVFLWSFLDKLFGLSFSTEQADSWIAGGSPTYGFLSFATRGPFAEFYQSIAGYAWVDFLFMAGLLLIGVCLLLGILVNIASYSGALMMLLMYTAVMPPATNPFMDSHIIYVFVFMGLAASLSGDYLGLGKKWKSVKLVKRYKILQ